MTVPEIVDSQTCRSQLAQPIEGFYIGTSSIQARFLLPVDAVTRRLGFVAVSGAGKTYAASVVAEEMLAAGQRICIIDPLGAWWGLRSSADGQHPAYGITVFGGEHADLPLPAGAGAVLGELIATEPGLSAIVDLSLLEPHEQHVFVTKLANAIHHHNRLPLHVFIDEADEFAPQQPQSKEQNLCRQAVSRLVRRARIRGVGTSQITQRSALIDKSPWNMVEALFVLRLTAETDHDALRSWFKANADKKGHQEVFPSLPKLPIGHAWCLSPGWLGISSPVSIRQRMTFDSSKTPEVGQPRITPHLAQLDLEHVRARLETVLASATSDDPVILREHIQDLERQLRNRPAAPTPTAIIREVPIFREGEVAAFVQAVAQLGILGNNVSSVAEALRTALDRSHASTSTTEVLEQATTSPTAAPLRQEDSTGGRQILAVGVENGHLNITATQQRMLDVLAEYEALGVIEGLDRNNLAVLSNQSPTSSAVDTNIRTLRGEGLVSSEPNKYLRLTEAGRLQARSSSNRPASPEALQQAWLSKLKPKPASMLRVLIQDHPNPVSRDDLAVKTAQSPTSSAVDGHLRFLRSVGLICYGGHNKMIALTDRLFLKK